MADNPDYSTIFIAVVMLLTVSLLFYKICRDKIVSKVVLEEETSLQLPESKDYYVDSECGSDAYSGDIMNPFATLEHAFTIADPNKDRIFVITKTEQWGK